MKINIWLDEMLVFRIFLKYFCTFQALSPWKISGHCIEC